MIVAESRRTFIAFAWLALVSTAAADLELPDLTVWTSETRNFVHGWSLDTDEIPGRALLRFDVALPNVGIGPFEIRWHNRSDGQQEIFQRTYMTDGSSNESLVGTFPIVPNHHANLQLQNMAHYNLRNVGPGNTVGSVVAMTAKKSECLVDSIAFDTTLPGTPVARLFPTCSRNIMGISTGYADLYSRFLHSQWIDVTGIADGSYWLEVIVDPFNQIQESNDENNTAQVLINLSGATVPEPSAVIMILTVLTMVGAVANVKSRLRRAKSHSHLCSAE